MNPASIFKQYLESQFKFPKDIKHDIIYCQRALKVHIKVHQMVLDVYKSQANPDPQQKKRIVDELEAQIYEINAEQHFLLVRLRRTIDEFYKALTRKGVPWIPEIMNEWISNEIVPLINDPSFLIYPINVRLRSTEEKLIEKYFEVKNNKNDMPANNCFEVLDSDEEEQEKVTNMAILSKVKQQKQAKDVPTQAALQCGSVNFGQQQTSLLKPISQRISNRDHYIDATQFLEVTDDAATKNLKGFKPSASNYKRKQDMSVFNGDAKITIEKEQREDPIVSKNVKMSRMNLRQALKKAHTETMAAKAAANVPTQMSNNAIASVISTEPVMPAKKYEGRGRPPRNINAAPNLPAMTTVKPIEVISSSDDSTPERSITPQQTTSTFLNEIGETRVKPEDYGQEMFLRLFGLFTPEMHVQMQQRRSKRKRRTVQSNERSDYHYGRFEYGSYPPPEDKKKRKDFLLSPQVKQRLQSKRPKRRSVEKADETNLASRSGSSSPDEKRACNECLKGGGKCLYKQLRSGKAIYYEQLHEVNTYTLARQAIQGSLEKCEECKAHFHATCHLPEVDIPTTSRAEKNVILNKLKSCPACNRQKQRLIKKEAKHNETLQSTAKELEQQMVAEKSRRTSLQHESELYKVQMNALYNIVKAIKSDAETSSD